MARAKRSKARAGRSPSKKRGALRLRRNPYPERSSLDAVAAATRAVMRKYGIADSKVTTARNLTTSQGNNGVGVRIESDDLYAGRSTAAWNDLARVAHEHGYALQRRSTLAPFAFLRPDARDNPRGGRRARANPEYGPHLRTGALAGGEKFKRLERAWPLLTAGKIDQEEFDAYVMTGKLPGGKRLPAAPRKATGKARANPRAAKRPARPRAGRSVWDVPLFFPRR